MNMSIFIFKMYKLTRFSLGLVRGQEPFELTLIILVEGFEIFNLVFVRLLIPLSILFVSLDDVDNFLVKACNFIFKLFAGLSELGDISLHLILFLFRHQCFSHTVRDGGLIQGLISLDSHFDFIPNTDEQEASLSTIDGDLTDQLIEALGIKLFSNGADTGFPSLPGLNFLIKLVL